MMRRDRGIWMGILLIVAGVSGCHWNPLGGGGRDSLPPVITNPSVQPGQLGFVGGEVTIRADVADGGGVAAVWAEITKPDASKENVSLVKTEGISYAGVWTAPGNPSETGEAAVHTVRIYARDGHGNEGGSDPMTVTVEAAPQPPGGAPF